MGYYGSNRGDYYRATGDIATLARRGAAALTAAGRSLLQAPLTATIPSMISAGARAAMQPQPGYPVGGGYRRMNPLNPKALRRALRRAQRFEHFAKSVVRITSPKKAVHGFKFKRRKKRI